MVRRFFFSFCYISCQVSTFPVLALFWFVLVAASDEDLDGVHRFILNAVGSGHDDLISEEGGTAAILFNCMG